MPSSKYKHKINYELDTLNNVKFSTDNSHIDIRLDGQKYNKDIVKLTYIYQLSPIVPDKSDFKFLFISQNID